MISRKWKGNNADGVCSVGLLGRSAGCHFNTKVVVVTTGGRDLGVSREIFKNELTLFSEEKLSIK